MGRGAPARFRRYRTDVGAVLLLVLLPIVAAIAAMFTLGGGLLTALTFTFLAGVVVFGALHMARNWDSEGDSAA
jgi:hypothetical protein